MIAQQHDASVASVATIAAARVFLDSRWIYWTSTRNNDSKVLLVVGYATNICIHKYVGLDSHGYYERSYIIEQSTSGTLLPNDTVNLWHYTDKECLNSTTNNIVSVETMSRFLPDVLFEKVHVVGANVTIGFSSDSILPIPRNEHFTTNFSYNSKNDCDLDITPVKFVTYSLNTCIGINDTRLAGENLIYFIFPAPFTRNMYLVDCKLFLLADRFDQVNCRPWWSDHGGIRRRTYGVEKDDEDRLDLLESPADQLLFCHIKLRSTYITESPTPGPTLLPTQVAPPIIALYAFTVEQELVGISAVVFNTSEINKAVFIKVVSTLTDLPETAMKIIRLSDIVKQNTNSNNALVTAQEYVISSCLVSYNITFNPGQLGYEYTDNPVATYDLITNRLQSKVDNGRFASTLQYISAEYNATDMSEVTTTIRHMSGWTVITRPQPNSNRATEGLGTVATGIVAAVAVVLFVGTMFGYWWFMVKIGDDGDNNRVQLGQIAPMPAVDAVELEDNRYPPLTVRALDVHQEHYAVESLHNINIDGNIYVNEHGSDCICSDCCSADNVSADIEPEFSDELLNNKIGGDSFVLMDLDDTADDSKNDAAVDKHSISLYHTKDNTDVNYLDSHENTTTAQQSVAQPSTIDTPTVTVRSKKYAKLAYGNSSSGQSPKSPAGRAALTGQFSLASYTTSEDCSDSGRNNGIELNALGSLKQ